MTHPMNTPGESRGVRTNGIGRASLAHLNLSRSLAETMAWPKHEPVQVPKSNSRKPRHKGPFCLSDGRLFLHQNGKRMTRDRGEAMTGPGHKMRLIKNEVGFARQLRILPA